MTLQTTVSFQEYSDAIERLRRLSVYHEYGSNLVYPVLGMVGEAGEVAEKVKKFWRNHGITTAAGLNTDQIADLAKELGDVLWYIDACARGLGVSLEYVAALNLAKVTDRHERGVVRSEGDNR